MEDRPPGALPDVFSEVIITPLMLYDLALPRESERPGHRDVNAFVRSHIPLGKEEVSASGTSLHYQREADNKKEAEERNRNPFLPEDACGRFLHPDAGDPSVWRLAGYMRQHGQVCAVVLA